jgi:hypothetical protein
MKAHRVDLDWLMEQERRNLNRRIGWVVGWGVVWVVVVLLCVVGAMR